MLLLVEIPRGSRARPGGMSDLQSKIFSSGSGSHCTSPALQFSIVVESPLLVDLLNLHVMLVKDSSSSYASICWRYFGLLAASSGASLSAAPENASIPVDADAPLAQSPVNSVASNDAELSSVPNVINRSFYYCKLCLEREQEQYRATAGRHGSLSSVQKYSVHTATTSYKTHLFNSHGVVDKAPSSVKLETPSFDELSDFESSLSTSKMVTVTPLCGKNDTPAWTTEEFHRDVCLWFIRDMQSVETVTERGFSEFCVKNFANFAAPCPTSLVCNWLEQMYADVKDQIRTSLQGVRAVCVMFDAWTDRHRRTPFIGVRLAYVELTSWTFRMATLSVKVVSHRTGAERADHIRAELSDFGVANDCIVYTTNDGSEAAQHCGRLLKSSHETLCVMRCLDRLVVGDALNQVPETMQLIKKCAAVIDSLCYRKQLTLLDDKAEKIKRLMELDEKIAIMTCYDDDMSVSVMATGGENESAEGSSRKSELLLVPNQVEKQSPETLNVPVCSRWNVVLTMMEGLLEMEPALHSALKKCGNHELCFDEHELSTMKALVKILAPFREFCEMVGGNHPHLGLLLMVRDQIEDLCRPCRRDASHIAMVKLKIRQNLERRIPIDDTVMAASILEPGTRAIVAVEQDEKVRIVTKIWNENENDLAADGCSSSWKGDGDLQSVPYFNLSCADGKQTFGNTVMQTAETTSCELGVESKRKRIIQQILQRRGLSIGGEETIQSEVTRYLNTKASEEEERTPLIFWKNNQKNFPRLHRLARNLLSIVAGSVVVNELFSSAGLHLSDKRTRLTLRELNIMSVLHDNYSLL